MIDGLKQNGATHAKCIVVVSGDGFKLENMTMKNFNETGAVIQASKNVEVSNCVFHSLGTVGLVLLNCDNSIVQRSFFGMDASGNPFPSFGAGALLVAGEQNTIGGESLGNYFGNIADANSFAINIVGNDNIVSYNTLGLNVTDGTAPNGKDGIVIVGESNRVYRNIIGNHAENEIVLKGATTSVNLIYENIIGANADLSQAHRNEIGIFVNSGANNNQVG